MSSGIPRRPAVVEERAQLRAELLAWTAASEEASPAAQVCREVRHLPGVLEEATRVAAELARRSLRASQLVAHLQYPDADSASSSSADA